MIDRKKKICKGCNTPQFIWARGCCKACDPGKAKNVDQVKEDKQKSTELNVYFASQVISIPHNCENCHQPLHATSKTIQRCVTAHILPKSKFESVATHPQNRMFLGVFCGCHSKWDDKGTEDRKKMPCYNIALDRLQEFSTHLTAPEQVSAEEYLGLEFGSL